VLPPSTPVSKQEQPTSVHIPPAWPAATHLRLQSLGSQTGVAGSQVQPPLDEQMHE